MTNPSLKSQTPLKVAHAVTEDVAFLSQADKDLKAAGFDLSPIVSRADAERLARENVAGPILVDVDAPGLCDAGTLALLAKRPDAVLCHRSDADGAIDLLATYPDARHLHGIGNALSRLLTRLASGPGGIEALVYDPRIIRGETVCEYAPDMPCLDRVQAFAEQVTRYPDFGSVVRTTTWELITNAIFDAPIDPETKARKHRGKRKSERMRVEAGHEVTLRYANDGRRFAVSVRDPFGSLTRHDVVDTLVRCRKRGADQVGMHPSGAGIGLYMLVSAAPCVDFIIVPGKHTEIVFHYPLDLTPRELDARPHSIHFFIQEPP
jgi:hypothetical protein